MEELEKEKVKMPTPPLAAQNLHLFMDFLKTVT